MTKDRLLMKQKSPEQSRIDRILAKRKKWLQAHEPICIFCGGHCPNGELAHKIRRSYSRELQTSDLNTGLAHNDCHADFDDHLEEAQRLPKFWKVMEDIKIMDQLYYNRILSRLEMLKV